MTLFGLIGIHTLRAVSLCNIGDSEGLIFKLDDETYGIFSDPMDGYRSCCREPCKMAVPLTNMFTCKVICEYSSDAGQDILTMRDIITGQTIIEIGTKQYDSYYPVHVFSYYPEGMACNMLIEGVNRAVFEGHLYRHYSGNEFRVLHVARDAADVKKLYVVCESPDGECGAIVFSYEDFTKRCKGNTGVNDKYVFELIEG